MTKSRKLKGGEATLKSACDQPGALCPQITAAGSSKMAISTAGADKNARLNAAQTKANKILAAGHGGGKRRVKKGGKEPVKIIAPQPASGVDGTVNAGGSSAAKNMATGTEHSMKSKAQSVHDSQAKALNINPPCDPFSGSCPSSGGGKRKSRRKNRKRKRRKTRKTRKTRKRRKTKRKNRKKRKSRKRRS